jgi:uncharacterized protein with PIN domain
MERIAVPAKQRLQRRVPDPPAFVADAHLRRLARILRLLGFDTLHSDACSSGEMIVLAARERRILITRHRELLKNGRIELGYWVRATEPTAQAREIIRKFGLTDRVHPFRRCTVCNGEIGPVDRQAIADRIPPKTALWLDQYFECRDCHRLYWRGTHFPRLERLIGSVTERPPASEEASLSGRPTEDLADS